MAQQHLAGQDLLIIEALQSNPVTPHSIGLLWTSDQPDATDLYLVNTQHSQETENPQIQQASGRKPTP
jgi:hypothetical protein